MINYLGTKTEYMWSSKLATSNYQLRVLKSLLLAHRQLTNEHVTVKTTSCLRKSSGVRVVVSSITFLKTVILTLLFM